MRRSLLFGSAAAAVLLLGPAARAVHHGHPHYAAVPVAGVPVVPYMPVVPVAPTAAPVSPGDILQWIQLASQFTSQFQRPGGQPNRPDNTRQQPSRPEPVPQDVQDTIARVDQKLVRVVKKSNGISKLNPNLYKGVVKKVKFSPSSSGSTSSGSTSGTGTGRGGETPGGPFGD